jgi:tetratricopeptide (TPR) repeat protein
LRDGAAVLAHLRRRLGSVQPEALALLNRGDFAAAAEALRRDCDARLARVGADRDADGVEAAAELCAAAAAVDYFNLDYRAAAEKYAAAARLVADPAQPGPGGGAAWRYRMAQGRALVDDGAARGAGDSLLAAVEIYDQALDGMSRGEAPHAWVAPRFHRGDALLASGVNDNAASRVEAAVASYRMALEEWTQDAAPFDWART